MLGKNYDKTALFEVKMINKKYIGIF